MTTPPSNTAASSRHRPPGRRPPRPAGRSASGCRARAPTTRPAARATPARATCTRTTSSRTNSVPQTHGRGEDQYDSSKPPQVTAEEELAGRKHPLSPEDAKSAERKVAALFLLSFVGVVGFVLTFFLVDQEYTSSTQYLYTPLLGVFMALALGGVGAGAVLWAKLLMVDEEAVQERHPFGSPKDERAATARRSRRGLEETGPAPPLAAAQHAAARRRLAGAAARAVPVRLGPVPAQGAGARDDGVAPGRPPDPPERHPGPLGDLQVGSIESVFPDVEHGTKIADSPTLLIRMRPEELQVVEGREDWSIDGPHRLLVDLHAPGLPGEALRAADAPPVLPVPPVDLRRDRGCKVVFGPAARPLPQLAIRSMTRDTS
jgi:ubiquinol-cytochrome c reductase iron-sulfur subunit